jgi:hypothetical protein
MAQSDARANAPDDAFNFNQRPRKFKKIPTAHGSDYFLRQPPDLRPPDAQ